MKTENQMKHIQIDVVIFFFLTVYVFLLFIMMTCFQMVSFHLFDSDTELKVELNRSSATKHLADPSSSASALH